jgi:hypothetical protein
MPPVKRKWRLSLGLSKRDVFLTLVVGVRSRMRRCRKLFWISVFEVILYTYDNCQCPIVCGGAFDVTTNPK